MLLKAKDVAFMGVMMAISVALITLGGYLEMSTLFFLAAASFLTGIVQRNLSAAAAAAFLAGTVLLSFFLAPQKLYCATFLAFSIYVICAECSEKYFADRKGKAGRGLVWLVKGMVYHILLFAALYLVQAVFGLETVFQGVFLSGLSKYRILFWLLAAITAEVFWLVFDRAYFYFQKHYGGMVAKLLQ